MAFCTRDLTTQLPSSSLNTEWKVVIAPKEERCSSTNIDFIGQRPSNKENLEALREGLKALLDQVEADLRG